MVLLATFGFKRWWCWIWPDRKHIYNLDVVNILDVDTLYIYYIKQRKGFSQWS